MGRKRGSAWRPGRQFARPFERGPSRKPLENLALGWELTVGVLQSCFFNLESLEAEAELCPQQPLKLSLHG
ncbi:unnamed protein product [Victoria cruziana]